MLQVMRNTLRRLLILMHLLKMYALFQDVQKSVQSSMHTIGDIVCAAESPETPLLVLETAGTTLRVAAFCGAAAEGALPFGPEDIEAPEALAAGTPQLPEAVDTWSISRLAAVRAQAWGCAQGCARLGGSAMDRVLRRMGRQTSRAHYAAVHVFPAGCHNQPHRAT